MQEKQRRPSVTTSADPKKNIKTSGAVASVDSVSGSLLDALDNIFKVMDPIVYTENLTAASLIVSATLIAYFIAWMRSGFVWILILLGFVSGVYNTNYRRLKSKVRRESLIYHGMMSLDSSTESVEWLNSFLTEFWKLYEPGLSDMIKGIVNDILISQKPSFLEDLRLTVFTLGSVSPRVQSIRTHSNSPPDTLIMDWELNFVPIDDDFDANNSSSRNSCIQLLAKLGVIPLIIKVKDIELTGLVYILK